MRTITTATRFARICLGGGHMRLVTVTEGWQGPHAVSRTPAAPALLETWRTDIRGGRSDRAGWLGGAHGGARPPPKCVLSTLFTKSGSLSLSTATAMPAVDPSIRIDLSHLSAETDPGLKASIVAGGVGIQASLRRNPAEGASGLRLSFMLSLHASPGSRLVSPADSEGAASTIQVRGYAPVQDSNSRASCHASLTATDQADRTPRGPLGVYIYTFLRRSPFRSASLAWTASPSSRAPRSRAPTIAPAASPPPPPAASTPSAPSCPAAPPRLPSIPPSSSRAPWASFAGSNPRAWTSSGGNRRRRSASRASCHQQTPARLANPLLRRRRTSQPSPRSLPPQPERGRGIALRV